MNQKQAIINYLREQTYTAINDLLTTSLTNEEILQEVGFIRVAQEVALIPGDILVTLNTDTKSTSPKTGSEGMFILLLAILLISGGTVTELLILSGKKRGKNRK